MMNSPCGRPWYLTWNLSYVAAVMSTYRLKINEYQNIFGCLRTNEHNIQIYVDAYKQT